MNDLERRILSDPKFRELVGKRQRLTTWLTALLVAAYFAFCLTAVWAPGVLGAPWREGSVLSLGVLVAYALIVASIGAAVYYVHRANTDLARLQYTLRGEEPE